MKKLRHLCCILISCLLLGGLPFGAAAGEKYRRLLGLRELYAPKN